ncbi:nonstructural protein [Blackfly microvirus SF02]|uniref:Nonstructural protein n=1 Tax=Blackfly microvirus SF02 TaxID=2576452 RepID=A0A4P8PU09_9VIRU|nr:nonstructural protein [Blackfly microvirus SF02]
MKMILIGIFDRKAQTFISLEPTPNVNVSLRQLTENVNTKSDSPLSKWPGDFSLWELGEWDSETGMAQFRENPDCQYEKKLVIECESLKTRETN